MKKTKLGIKDYIIVIYKYMVLIFVIPLVLFSYIKTHKWSYYYCAIFASKIPFVFGDSYRFWFYKMTLKEFGDNSRIMFGAVIQTNDCIIGDNVFIGNYSLISHTKIGDDTMFGPFVNVISGSKSHGIKMIDVPIRLQEGVEEFITIGQDVWVGSNATIMNSIGNGCVLGAGSVLTKKIADYDIAVGNPAKVIKNRKD